MDDLFSLSTYKQKNNQGFALIAVLWALILLSLIAGQFTYQVRTGTYTTRNFIDQFRLQQAANSGVEVAIHAFRQGRKLDADGHDHFSFILDGIEISVNVLDEAQKLNINRADDIMMATFLSKFTKSREQADILAQRIADWRDEDGISRPLGAEDQDYGFIIGAQPYLPRNGNFLSSSELLSIPGMTFKIYSDIQPFITLFDITTNKRPLRTTLPPASSVHMKSALIPWLNANAKNVNQAEEKSDNTSNSGFSRAEVSDTPFVKRSIVEPQRTIQIIATAKLKEKVFVIRKATIRVLNKNLSTKIISWH